MTMPTSESHAQDGSNSNSPNIARSASYNHLPQLNPDNQGIDMKRNLSEFNLTTHSTTEPQAIPLQDDVETGKQILRQSSLRSSKTQHDQKFSKTNTSTSSAPKPKPKIPGKVTSPERAHKPSKSGTFSSLTLRPWKASRPPSPSQPSKNSAAGTVKKERLLSKTPAASTPKTGVDAKTDTEVVGRKNNKSSPPTETLTKPSRRSISAVRTKGKSEPDAKISRSSSISSMRRRPSMERLVASVGLKKDVPPVPQTPNTHQARLKPDSTRKKDELWNVFRSLDVDYQKFQSKSTTFKANVIRSSLLPCLARYSDHPSNQHLRPEDLDRRTNILNKWWTGLLEMVGGRNSQSLTGTDRPVYLEAIVAIMSRPEWRIPNSLNSSPEVPTAAQKTGLAAGSNTSLESAGSDFLVESIHHNVRNTFTQNLLSQMGYAIDRMSIRHTPASLVSFCGKTCAYAFFFCGQVADVLVRLWNIPSATLRRVANGFDIDHNPAIRTSLSDEISARFPPAVRSLSFSAHSTLVRYLRRNVPIPLAASHINWFGPWVSRWTGRDTDLFFIFLKNFYILLSDFLPANTELSKRVYVPGMVPVHAQMLTVLENNLNKETGLQSSDGLHNTTSATFDDFIYGADATVSTLPLRPPNALRLMSESRLIFTLRDILADPSIKPDTKQIFVESFCAILKSGARKTSLFDHNSCFSLCDFVEELISIIPPYCRSANQPELLDWEFWLDVCNQMMKSNNALTEVRTFAFIFAAWDEINKDAGTKDQLCLGLLLHEERFYRYFSHWSPMVRAYFHRLICWKLARYDGGAQSSLDIRIYNTLSNRLGKIWSDFLVHQSKAEKGLIVPLSTAPCTPAPGRRIIIIRNDYYPPPPSMFVCLDNIIPPSLSATPALNNESDPLKNTDNKGNSGSEPAPPQIKKTWKMLRTIFKSPANPKPGEVTPPSSSNGSEAPDALTSGDNNPTVPDGQQAQKASDDDENQADQSSVSETPTKNHPIYTFRFCLEWIDRQKWPSRNRHLYPPSLPSPARLYMHSFRKASINQSDSGSGSVSNSFSGAGSDNGSETDSAEETLINQVNLTTTTVPSTNDETKIAPTGIITQALTEKETSAANKYAGRALAEWAMIVSECDNFFERRRDEGVPCDKLVEVPTLGVDSFRK